MSSRAPWDRDDRELESLKAQLRQTQVECQGLKDVILNKEASFSQLNTDLKQAVHSLRAEMDRTAELEERSNKTQEVSPFSRFASTRGNGNVFDYRTCVERDYIVLTSKSRSILQMKRLQARPRQQQIFSSVR
jgi:hypothetical protein